VDADGKTLGRLATELARRLRGKHKPEFTPHVDTGDYIVVINAEKVHGSPATSLMTRCTIRHTGYIGHMKSETLGKRMQRAPEQVIEEAVKGMLPKNSLGRQMLTKLRIFAGAEHTHQAQQPQLLEI
jgi:large subunit ribosomal protein L13